MKTEKLTFEEILGYCNGVALATLVSQTINSHLISDSLFQKTIRFSSKMISEEELMGLLKSYYLVTPFSQENTDELFKILNTSIEGFIDYQLSTKQ